MAAKRKPVKKAARRTGAKRAARPAAKSKGIAARTVGSAAKRRPAAAKPKAKTKESKAPVVRAKAVATPPVKARGSAPERPTPKSRPEERRPAMAEARPAVVAPEPTVSTENTVVQPVAGAAVSTTTGEENGTPGLPVPIASFTI